MTKLFFNKIILIPTLECTFCLILTWFPPTSLIWSISELPPQLHTSANYLCNHLQLSRSKLPENLWDKKAFFSGAVLAFCHFRNHFFGITPSSLNYANMFGIFYLSTLSGFITIHNLNICWLLLYLSSLFLHESAAIYCIHVVLL